jgi:uncharacterized protein (DUF2141 family)
MGKHILFLASLLFIAKSGSSQFRLEVEFSELKSNKGQLMIQLYDEKQNVVDQQKGVIIDNKCTIFFNDLKEGKYGIRFYHDEDLSGKMETNLLGIPLEGYGFSNEATGKFGPPPFKKWLFLVDGNKKLVMKPHY